MKTSKEARKKIFSELNSIQFERVPHKMRAIIPPIRRRNKEGQIDQFVSLLEMVKAQVIRSTKAEMPNVLHDLICRKELSHIVLPSSSKLKSIIQKIKFSSFQPSIHYYDQSYDDFKKTLYAADAAFSEAQWGIAETGSLVIRSGKQNPRTLSLVPPVHLCLIEEKNIYSDLKNLIVKENLADKMPTNLIFISGPSRTADIEFNITLGIHGPKELIVFLVT